MFKVKFFPILVALAALSIFMKQGAFAQGTTTLRDPLVPGAPSEPISIPAPPGAPPAH